MSGPLCALSRFIPTLDVGFVFVLSCGNVAMGVFPSMELAIRSVKLTAPNHFYVVQQGTSFATGRIDGEAFTVVAVKVSAEACKLYGS
jgi:hypothetical protein